MINAILSQLATIFASPSLQFLFSFASCFDIVLCLLDVRFVFRFVFVDNRLQWGYHLNRLQLFPVEVDTGEKFVLLDIFPRVKPKPLFWIEFQK